MRAHYATTTPYYRHVVSALAHNYDTVALQRRYQLDERTFNRLKPILPHGLRNVVERRVQAPVEAERVFTLRRWSYEPALYTRLGRRMSTSTLQSLVTSTAREVRRRSSNADVLQFTDGIGFLALRDHQRLISVMERRHVHHGMLQHAVEPWQGFPARAAREPIPDILDEEYAGADAIVVYSDAARATFLAQGFPESKVHTVHRGASSLPNAPDVDRDPRLAIYVGRGDADKGLDVAVGAIQRLGGDVRLQVAGPLTKEVLEWLSKYSHVEYVGLLNRPELSRLYSRATLLVLPSIESFGLAMTDAASVGVRVVCADTAGIGPELGPMYSSVVHGRDVDDWASRIAVELERESDDLRQERALDDSIQRRFSWSESEAAMDRLHRHLRTGLGS